MGNVMFGNEILETAVLNAVRIKFDLFAKVLNTQAYSNNVPIKYRQRKPLIKLQMKKKNTIIFIKWDDE